MADRGRGRGRTRQNRFGNRFVNYTQNPARAGPSTPSVIQNLAYQPPPPPGPPTSPTPAYDWNSPYAITLSQSPPAPPIDYLHQLLPFQSLAILSTALIGLKVLLQFLHLPTPHTRLLDFKVSQHFLHLVRASYLSFKVYLDLIILL